MARSDLARKLASLATIALLLGVSAWLRPAHAPEWLPSYKLTGPAIEPPRLGEAGRTGVGQTGVRPGSDPEYDTTQVSGPNEGQELPVLADPAAVESERPAPIADLAASRPMTPTDVPVALTPDAPRIVETVASTPADPRDPVAGALVTAGRRTGSAMRTGAVHTGGAFRTAGRAIRSIF